MNVSMVRRGALVRATILIVGAALVVVLAGRLQTADDAHSVGDPMGEAVPGTYIVMLSPEESPKETAFRLNLPTRTYYRAALNGFTAQMSPERAAQVAKAPGVESVEPARLVGVALHENSFQTLVPNIDRIDAEENPATGIGGPPGPNVDARIAIIDTGIHVSHADLNVVGGFGSYQERVDDEAGSAGYGACNSAHNFDDDHGHGTHVAGTAGAIDNSIGVVGVAPGAALYAVRVLRDDGFGCDADVIRGIDWVTERKQEYKDGAADGDAGIDFTVVNMSLGGLPSQALCNAISNSVAEGIMYAVAAGNNKKDAAFSGPANCPNVVTVSAYADYDGLPGGLGGNTCSWTGNPQQTADDKFAWFSNYGSMVDIAAPGVCVMSTYPGEGAGLYGTMSGTSMATPHVAGAMALLHAEMGFSGPYDGLSVMEQLTSLGWTRPQNSACGFGDDPDEFPEPVLYLGGACPTVTFTPSPSPTPSPSLTPTASPTPIAEVTPTPMPSPTATPVGSNPADIDCDELVTGLDSILLMRFAAQLEAPLGPDCPPIGALIAPDQGAASLRGDLNCDGVVNQADALVVLWQIAALPGSESTPCVH